jgi:hypothetical protein
LATATAQRSGAIATATSAKLVRKGKRKSVTAHSNRVTNCDGSAVHIDNVVANSEIMH